MKLIDADALLGKIIFIDPFRRKVSLQEAFAVQATKDEFYKTIAKFPVIDAKPVRHGKWIDKADGGKFFGETIVQRKCSECLTWSSLSMKGDRIPLNYCPNCGAKMDGKDED